MTKLSFPHQKKLIFYQMFKFLLQLNEELDMERWNLGFTRIREENNNEKVD
jgi:hypothetical protein